jgi:hypothetical protein
VGEIDLRLRNRPPCRAVVEAGIRPDADNHYKADVAATCTPTTGKLHMEEPILVVEAIFREFRARRFRAQGASLRPPVAGAGDLEQFSIQLGVA